MPLSWCGLCSRLSPSRFRPTCRKPSFRSALDTNCLRNGWQCGYWRSSQSFSFSAYSALEPFAGSPWSPYLRIISCLSSIPISISCGIRIISVSCGIAPVAVENVVEIPTLRLLGDQIVSNRKLCTTTTVFHKYLRAYTTSSTATTATIATFATSATYVVICCKCVFLQHSPTV